MLRLVGILVVTFVVVIVSGMGVFYIAEIYLPFRGEHFDTARWLAAPPIEAHSPKSCVRAKMVDDLRSNHIVEGTSSKHLVVSKIGQGTIPGHPALNAACDYYYLGFCSPISSNAMAMLEVCYDSKGILNKAVPKWIKAQVTPLQPSSDVPTFRQRMQELQKQRQHNEIRPKSPAAANAYDTLMKDAHGQ